MDGFKRMTNWFIYRLQDDILTGLFNEGYNSIVSLQSIVENDLSTFINMNIPRAQISMLRRLVECLNCRLHPPVYPRAGGSHASLGDGDGPVGASVPPVTSVTSTAPSTAVGHTHQANSHEAQNRGSGPASSSATATAPSTAIRHTHQDNLYETQSHGSGSASSAISVAPSTAVLHAQQVDPFEAQSHNSGLVLSSATSTAPSTAVHHTHQAHPYETQNHSNGRISSAATSTVPSSHEANPPDEVQSHGRNIAYGAGPSRGN